MNMKKLLLISMMLMTVLAMAACEDSGDEPFTPEHPELSGPSGGEDENESEVPDVSSLQVNIMVSNRTILPLWRTMPPHRIFLLVCHWRLR